MNQSKPAAYITMYLLASCASQQGVDWDLTELDIHCTDHTIQLSSLYENHREVLLSFMRTERTYDENISYDRPSATGYRQSGDRHLIEFVFTDPNENSDELTLDGGMTVTLDACLGQPISTAMIAW